MAQFLYLRLDGTVFLLVIEWHSFSTYDWMAQFLYLWLDGTVSLLVIGWPSFSTCDWLTQFLYLWLDSTIGMVRLTRMSLAFSLVFTCSVAGYIWSHCIQTLVINMVKLYIRFHFWFHQCYYAYFKCSKKKKKYIYIYIYLSPFARYSQWRCAWPWHLEWAKVKHEYANPNNMPYVLCNDNSNICPICHSLPYIYSWNVHDFDFWNGPRSKIIISIKEVYSTSYLMVTIMFAVSVTIYKIFAKTIKKRLVFVKRLILKIKVRLKGE